MTTITLASGTVDYEDTGGSGPVIVLLHGMLMSGSLWDDVVADLRTDNRCIVPTLPLGSHRHPMPADADMSPFGVARMINDLIERLALDDVVLVGCDTGGALAQMAVSEGAGRVGRLVLVSCDAYDNFPPGLPGKMLALTSRPPGGLYLGMSTLRVRWMRRLPLTWGWMSKRPVPDDVFRGWLRPLLHDREVRRDAQRFLRAVDPADTTAAAERLRGFDRPALVVWAAEDKVMPPEHGRRLADALPQGRLVEIPDSYTLVPIDQPAALATALREFVAGTTASSGGARS